MTVDQPAFPRELERTILELAALQHPKSIPNYMLVAWRVKEWLHPILFRSLIIDVSDGWQGPNSELPSCTFATFEELLRKYGPLIPANLRNVMLVNLSRDDEKKVFSACPNVVNVHSMGNRHSLDLRRDEASLVHLTGLTQLTIGGREFRVSLTALSPSHFSHLTHLYIHGGGGSLMVAALVRPHLGRPIAQLPRLTHLAIIFEDIWSPRLVADVLQSKTLRLFAIRSWQSMENEAKSVKDPRAVFILLHPGSLKQDWFDAVCGRDRFWEQAERRLELEDSSNLGGDA
ncbi:hypothetical protein MKEN_00849000 [Mycena kentingensis (nom. inval.)]|nr:hypothetical protein MKEN_00849000 [Mycena kentingensis (nom. inval.)]